MSDAFQADAELTERLCRQVDELLRPHGLSSADLAHERLHVDDAGNVDDFLFYVIREPQAEWIVSWRDYKKSLQQGLPQSPWPAR